MGSAILSLNKRWNNIRNAIGITVLMLLLFAGNAGASLTPVLLKINGNEQTGGYISSCWKEEKETYSICGDSFSINTAAKPLVTSSPFIAYLSLPLQEPPGELGISTAKVTDKNKLSEGIGTANGSQAWNIDGWKRYNVSLGADSDINLSLEPGLYVLNVFARWEGKGDVSYVFLVQVYEPEAKITAHATEKSAGFQFTLAITIFLAVIIAGLKRK